MDMTRGNFNAKRSRAWLLLVTAFLIHVVDEAAANFLGFYNPLVLALRRSLGFSPAPTFSVGVWVTLLAAAIVSGYIVTPWVRRGNRVMRIVVNVFGVVMALNAFGHLVGSIYFSRILPGFWSSAILLIAAMYALICVRRDDKKAMISPPPAPWF